MSKLIQNWPSCDAAREGRRSQDSPGSPERLARFGSCSGHLKIAYIWATRVPTCLAVLSRLAIRIRVPSGLKAAVVSDTHRTATQLDWFPIFARHQLVVVKSLHRLFRGCRRDRVLGSRRLPRRNRASKSLLKHADRTEFHRSRKLIATAWTDALGLRFHGSERPSEASKASQRAWISSSACRGAAWDSGVWL